MGKRANGEGTIYKRADGRWTARLSLAGGRRKDYFGKTRQEVAVKLAAATKQRQDGIPIIGEQQKVDKYLEGWLKTVRPNLRPRTFQRYEQYVRLHITPFIGSYSLSRLSPQHLQSLYANRLESGLSATSVHHLHAVIHRALRDAARFGLVVRNVASIVSPPRIERSEMHALSPQHARAFLLAAQSDRLGALYVIALTTGMRQGELLALHWEDVDLERASLRVRATLQRTPSGLVFAEPKTANSRRQITLGQSAVDSLRQHRVRQNSERLRLGGGWQDGDLVFANEVGRPIEATNLLRRSFKPLLSEAGLPSIRFHDLRHTAASLLLGEGIHPKIVSEMLGHSQISVTLDLYSHVTPTMQKQAAEAINALIQA